MPQVQTGVHSGQAERLTDTLTPVESEGSQAWRRLLPLTCLPIHPKIAARGRSAL